MNLTRNFKQVSKKEMQEIVKANHNTYTIVIVQKDEKYLVKNYSNRYYNRNSEQSGMILAHQLYKQYGNKLRVMYNYNNIITIDKNHR